MAVVGITLFINSKMDTSRENIGKKGSVVYINFDNEWTENSSGISRVLNDGGENFYSLLEKLKAIKNDEEIKGLLLKMDGLSLDNGQIEEVAKAFQEIKKENKFILSYAENFDNKNYSLALNSDKIFMPPTTTAGSFITGYYSSIPYYKKLADNLGIGVNIIHVGDYKAFGENYAKENMSPQFRENILELKDGIYDDFVEKISLERKMDRKTLNDEILAGKFVSMDVNSLKACNLIDATKYLDEIKEEIGKNEIISLAEYIKEKKISKNKIAIIYADGDISMDGEKGGITPENMIRKIDRAIKDENIKGIVLRVNSPGGSALASNLIYHKLEMAKKIKPVYVSIGGVSASGGYYIASAGNKIFGDKDSITGSIGVVSLIPNFKKLVNGVGVNIETIKKGEYSDLYSLTENFTAKDREKIYNSSLKIYDEFLSIVAKNRNRSKEYIDSIGGGRVWLGSRAIKLGLIDEIGGLEDTIEELSKDLNLNEYQTVEFIEKPNLKLMLVKYFPMAKTLYKINGLMPNKELYFKPLYYFPYEINK